MAHISLVKYTSSICLMNDVFQIWRILNDRNCLPFWFHEIYYELKFLRSSFSYRQCQSCPYFLCFSGRRAPIFVKVLTVLSIKSYCFGSFLSCFTQNLQWLDLSLIIIGSTFSGRSDPSLILNISSLLFVSPPKLGSISLFNPSSLQ